MSAALRRRWDAIAGDIWPIVQQTAAATVAWLIAKHLIDHHEPFFAPISALVGLNTSIGERGRNAVRLLQGVLLGIGVGELVLVTLGGGYGTVALATFIALVLARAVGGARIVLAQAAIGAILTVAVANGEVGVERITDALIGTGVALVFSQALFSPDPLRLLRRVETGALASMASALDLAADALDRGDDELADRAVDSQRELRDQLTELARIRTAGPRVARHSLVWRSRVAPVAGEKENAGHLDLLGTSCLLLTRTSLNANAEDRRRLAPGVRALSSVLGDLASAPGEQVTRQRAVDRSLEILRDMRSANRDPDADVTATLTAARMAVTDLMRFAGVDTDEAAATRPDAPAEHGDPEVRAVPPRRTRFGVARRWIRSRRRARTEDAGETEAR